MKINTNYALKRAAQCRELGDYSKAQEYLDMLIESDPENHMIWYEKSMLPIVQEDIIAVKNRSLSLSTYQKLPLPEMSSYLQQCGFEITELPEVEACLRATNLVASQRTKYLKMAIRHAPEDVKSVYMAELSAITSASESKGRKDINAAVATGVIALLVSLLTVFVIYAYNSALFFRIPTNVIILLLIPYALSVTGMTLYTKAKNGGNSTAAGLASNLTALIISNLSIVNAAILFFTK